ncbi:lytic transglycosylase domain-containing protein [Asticcacaulis excentricus]|uniref:Lytic transglycosylase catalytic n=1 Tax=Asticcacaulis excentricus (strain ATCC 15261 / DSM 4724 / KCTC 12464 / NCIMB 9791 / VKM B-1370 / CB 48) TaxID=573065 RepID=E8RUQ7_ASTEC|nr:lytic transglycosylase domain-containing protein [Asticcacaulis excentricus]ADU14107.1 Lytic transglycosylase catalytic [Asticcacaulis excentricus CB 48]
MIRWKSLVSALGVLLSTGESHAQAPPALARWVEPVREASQRFGVPEDWIYRVMQAESGGQTHLKGQPIRSKVGAMGLMQLMPGTWSDMRRAHNLGADPDDPRDNILAGTAYLRAMFDRFGYPGLFAAYNAGPARYAASLKGETLPAETRAYFKKLVPESQPPVPEVPSLTPSGSGLFAIKRTAEAEGRPKP